MDIGFEGNFHVHRKSVNVSICKDWIEDCHQIDDWVRLRKTNFELVFANDIFQPAKIAWTSYFKKYGYDQGLFHLDSIVDMVKLHYAHKFTFPHADVVTGGFPCQDFSVAGKRNGFNSHKDHNGNFIDSTVSADIESRGLLYIWMKRVIEIVKPRVFIAENVKGLVSLKDAKEIIESDFRTIGSGYIVRAKILKAPDYGVPQSRHRVIFIGLKREALTSDALKHYNAGVIPDEYDIFPPITHTGKPDQTLFSDACLPYVTAGDYLLDLDEPHLSSDMSQMNYSKAKWYGRKCQGQTEVNLLQVGPTIRAEHHGNIEFRRLSPEHGGNKNNEINDHFIERRLTVRECARLQTFPDDYAFVQDHIPEVNYGKISASNAYKLVGNAVPPLLAYHISSRLEKLWPLIFK